MANQNVIELTRLLEKANAGDAAALNLLCRRLEQTIRGYFIKRFDNPTLIDDLCQDTYLRFIKNVKLIRDAAKLKNFVTKVAFHVMQDHFKHVYAQKEEPLEPFSREEDSQHERQQEKSPAVSFADDLQMKMDLQEALASLPAKSRDILLMKSRGYNYEEIAARLDLSVSGVKMQVKRSIEQLKGILITANVTFLLFHSTMLIERLLEIIKN